MQCTDLLVAEVDVDMRTKATSVQLSMDGESCHVQKASWGKSCCFCNLARYCHVLLLS